MAPHGRKRQRRNSKGDRSTKQEDEENADLHHERRRKASNQSLKHRLSNLCHQRNLVQEETTYSFYWPKRGNKKWIAKFVIEGNFFESGRDFESSKPFATQNEAHEDACRNALDFFDEHLPPIEFDKALNQIENILSCVIVPYFTQSSTDKRRWISMSLAERLGGVVELPPMISTMNDDHTVPSPMPPMTENAHALTDPPTTENADTLTDPPPHNFTLENMIGTLQASIDADRAPQKGQLFMAIRQDYLGLTNPQYTLDERERYALLNNSVETLQHALSYDTIEDKHFAAIGRLAQGHMTEADKKKIEAHTSPAREWVQLYSKYNLPAAMILGKAFAQQHGISVRALKPSLAKLFLEAHLTTARESYSQARALHEQDADQTNLLYDRTFSQTPAIAPAQTEDVRSHHVQPTAASSMDLYQPVQGQIAVAPHADTLGGHESPECQLLEHNQAEAQLQYQQAQYQQSQLMAASHDIANPMNAQVAANFQEISRAENFSPREEDNDETEAANAQLQQENAAHQSTALRPTLPATAQYTPAINNSANELVAQAAEFKRQQLQHAQTATAEKIRTEAFKASQPRFNENARGHNFDFASSWSSISASSQPRTRGPPPPPPRRSPSPPFTMTEDQAKAFAAMSKSTKTRTRTPGTGSGRGRG